MTVAEPLEHRAQVAREIQMGLGLPLLIVIPVALLAIILAVQASLAPFAAFARGWRRAAPEICRRFPQTTSRLRSARWRRR